MHVWYDEATSLRFEWNPESAHYVNVFVRVRSPEGQLAYVLIDSLDSTLVFKDSVRPRAEEVVPVIERALKENLIAQAQFTEAEGHAHKRRWFKSSK
jgi:hypothetical protein